MEQAIPGLGRVIVRLAMIAALVLVALVQAEAQTARIEVIPPGKAWSQFLEKWDSFRLHLEREETAAARKALNSALESKWDGALGDLPVPAIALVRRAEKLYSRGELENAAWLTQMAQRLAPGSAHIHLALARYYLGGGPFSPGQSFSHYLQALSVLGDDFPALYRFIGRATIYFLALLGYWGVVFGLLMVARYGALLFHDFKDLFPQEKVPGLMIKALFGVLLFLPLGAGLSFWWIVSWWFLGFSLYMKRSERVIVYIWFLLLAGSPWVIERYSVFAGTRSDEALQAILRVRNGIPLPDDRGVLEQALEKTPDDLLVRFGLAQLLTRQERFQKAVSIYGPVLDEPRTAQEAYNNLAEIYLWAGDLDSVYRALSEATQKGPTRVEIVYNLGQYFNESEQLVRMEEEYKSARSIDEKRLDELVARSGPRRLNRIMASLPIPWSLVWERSKRGSALANASSAGLWKKWMGAPDGLGFFAACGGGLVLVLLLNVFSRRWRLSYRCASCGNPICLRCQKPAKDPAICSPCYHVFRGEGGVDLKIKMQKRAEVQRYRDLRSRAGMVISLLVPGSGQLLSGRTGTGLLLLALSGLLWSGFISGIMMWPGPGLIYQGGVSGHAVIMILIYLLLMVVSVLIFRSQAEGGR